MTKYLKDCIGQQFSNCGSQPTGGSQPVFFVDRRLTTWKVARYSGVLPGSPKPFWGATCPLQPTKWVTVVKCLVYGIHLVIVNGTVNSGPSGCSFNRQDSRTSCPFCRTCIRNVIPKLTFQVNFTYQQWLAVPWQNSDIFRSKQFFWNSGFKIFLVMLNTTFQNQLCDNWDSSSYHSCHNKGGVCVCICYIG